MVLMMIFTSGYTLLLLLIAAPFILDAYIGWVLSNKSDAFDYMKQELLPHERPAVTQNDLMPANLQKYLVELRESEFFKVFCH